MPTSNTRRCRTCAQPHNASSSVLWTSPNNRNFYYCQGCAASELLTCSGCHERHPNRNVRTITNSTICTSLGITASNRPALLCQNCWTRMTWICSTCAMTEFNVIVPRPTGDQPLCRHCISDQTQCARCQKPASRRNSHRLDSWDSSGAVACPNCVNTPIESKTFLVNKSKRSVGLELEYLQPKDTAAVFQWGCLKADGSIHGRAGDPHRCGDQHGREFNSLPINGDDALHMVDNVCDAIKKVKGFTNETCGIHIHLDLTKSTAQERENILQWWYHLEPVFLLLVDKHRHTNHFCTPLHSSIPADGRRARYGALNCDAFQRHKTYEIRLHHSTLDSDDIKGWILCLLAFFDTFQYITPQVKLKFKSIEERILFFFQQCRLPLKLRKYIVRAAKKHQNFPILQKQPISFEDALRTAATVSSNQVTEAAFRAAMDSIQSTGFNIQPSTTRSR